MSCNFHAIKCKSCPKYNACLLQMVYSNTLTLATMVTEISTQIEALSKQSFSAEDNVDMFHHLDTLSTKLDTITESLQNDEDKQDERTIDNNLIQSSLDTINSKLDDLIRSYNSYEFVPIVEKD